jgi:riboflavin synthase
MAAVPYNRRVFTGLIQDLGKVVAASGDEVRRLTVATALPAAQFAVGESIAVDGVCLTVVERGAGTFSVEAGAETLARTTVQALRVGDHVHLERALAMGERLGGHLVLGHVDAVAKVGSARDEAGGRYLELIAPASLLPLVLEKGSIAVDGVSLTVNGVRGDRFSVFLIPETLRRTKLGSLATGAMVNLETDILGKYVARLMGPLMRRQLEPDKLASGLVLEIA